MMNPHLLKHSWPDYSCMVFDTDEVIYPLGLQMDDFEFSPSLDSAEDSSVLSSAFSSTLSFSSMPFEFLPYQDFLFSAPSGDVQQGMLTLHEFGMNSDEYGMLSNLESLNDEMLDVSGWVDEISQSTPPFHEDSHSGEGSMSSSVDQITISGGMSPSFESSNISGSEVSNHSPVVFSSTRVEFDNKSRILNLLEAYREAKQGDDTQVLAKVIARRIAQMSSPVGATMERFSHYMFRGSEKQSRHLKQESSKNYRMARRAFYDQCPYGRFAHFAANSTIISAIPLGVNTMHIVDFDIQEGVQWADLIESVSLDQERPPRMKITSIKSESDHDTSQSMWKFEETRKWLLDFARSRCVRLTVEEMSLEDLLQERRWTKKGRSRGKEWWAFNCMVGLPHMGKGRRKAHAWEFLRVAHELLTDHGIITFGDGDAPDKGLDVGAQFDGGVQHFKALLESMEWHFPSHLSDARTAMECLFVGPSISSLAHFNKSEEGGKVYCSQPLELQPWRLSTKSLEEAKNIVREADGVYEVKIGGANENEMVLEWGGAPLVRVSAWR